MVGNSERLSLWGYTDKLQRPLKYPLVSNPAHQHLAVWPATNPSRPESHVILPRSVGFIIVYKGRAAGKVS